MNTGEIIMKCRNELGWTRADLARKSGISANTIWTVEHRDNCNVDTLEQLLRPMGYVVIIDRVI